MSCPMEGRVKANIDVQNTITNPCTTEQIEMTASSISNGNKMDTTTEILLLEEQRQQSEKYSNDIGKFYDDQIKQHFLDAVKRNAYDVVVTLCENVELNTNDDLNCVVETSTKWSYVDFPPLILAAQLGHYDIIKYLLSKGFRIETPHDIQCSCDNCHIDYLRSSQERLALYKALANPVWITLTTDDPILTAFTLSTKMNALACQEDEFENEYLDLYKSCKNFAVSLLSECCDSKEQETLLNFSHESQNLLDSGDRRLGLLKKAISMEQKEFVAHTFSQHLLMSLIFKVATKWRKNNITYKILYVISRVLLYPFMAIAYIIFPCWSVSATMKEPLIKFINHTTAFIVFLSLLAISSTQVLQIRSGNIPSGLEVIIICYILGLMWSECKQLWSEGLIGYLTSGWNWMDLSMLLMQSNAYLIWTIAAIIASFHERNYGEKLRLTVSVADGMYAFGIVMSFFRLIYLCQISRYLGLLQLCLSRMVRVILQFAFISFVVLWSFSIGMHMLYTSTKYFPGKNHTQPPGLYEDGGGFMKLSWYGDHRSFKNSIATMTWASFNMIELKSLRAFDDTNMIQFWSATLFTIYHVSTMIILLNMLIAMMANSYQQIEDNIEVEFKFARAQMWIEFFDDVATLPSPFNIVPSPKSITRIITLIVEKICGKSWSISYNGKRKFSLHRAGTYCNIEKRKQYLELCKKLVRRYLSKKRFQKTKKNDKKDGVETNILKEMKETLEEMKELLNTQKIKH